VDQITHRALSLVKNASASSRMDESKFSLGDPESQPNYQTPSAMVSARFLLTTATYPKKISCYQLGLRNS
jgi:hypothetical protein